MSKLGFSTYERQAYLNSKVETLRSLYAEAEEKIKKKLSRLDITAKERYRSQMILTEVRNVIRGLNAETKKWVLKNIPRGYERGFDIAGARLKILGVTRRVDFDAQIHTSSINILADEVTRDLLEANRSINKNISSYIRRTQQKIIEDNKISRMIASGVIEGVSRRNISDKMLAEIKTNMGAEKFIKINGRMYQPKKYAELVARTRMREATSRAVKSTCLQYEVDLVQWDVHSGACEECQQFSGRVFSISGSNEEFPALTIQPPVHPNCECNLLPVTQSFLERRYGERYSNLVDLSNDDLPIKDFRTYQDYLREGTV
jgi:hypothetical protein